MVVPGEGLLLPSSRDQGFVPGRGVDEIDVCIRHRHVKSNVARPTCQSTKVIHASLSCVEFFRLQSSYGSKRF